MRLSVHKFLYDLNVAPSFQLAHVRGYVPMRQASLAHQKEEVRALDNVQVCHDHEPGKFVDQTVDLRDGLVVFAVCVLT